MGCNCRIGGLKLGNGNYGHLVCGIGGVAGLSSATNLKKRFVDHWNGIGKHSDGEAFRGQVVDETTQFRRPAGNPSTTPRSIFVIAGNNLSTAGMHDFDDSAKIRLRNILSGGEQMVNYLIDVLLIHLIHCSKKRA